MHQSTLLLQACLFFLSLFIERVQADCQQDVAGNNVEQWCSEVACGSPSPPKNGDGGVTVVAVSAGTNGKRALWDPELLNNSTWPQPGYTYQVSPYYKPAARLRECSGSIITSYDTIHANLDGRGQTFVSQRNASCKESSCANAPIKLFSGRGDSVTIIKEDIMFPWGVMHIADRLFTTPLKLSTTLNSTAPTAFRKLINAFIAYDNIPSTTFFIPSDTALARSCSYTLAPGEARTLMNAQSVRDFVAYSPTLVDGAFFKAGNGEDITITVKADGTKYANGIKIVQQDIIVENGVVHIIDGLFSSPSTSCAGPPQSKTVTVISTIYQQSTVYQPGPTVTQATFCPSAPTTTIYQNAGSCIPSTTTIFQGQSVCPAPSTTTTTLTPSACTPQGPGSSCPIPVTTTTTISPTTCNGPPAISTKIISNCPNPGTSCPSAGLVTTTATYCPPTGTTCPPAGIVTTTTTTTLSPPGSTCPSVPTRTTTITTTSLTGGPPGINITVTSYSYTPGPTLYITTSICAPVVGPPISSISYKSEDCDAHGVPYGPNNPRPIISYMMQGIGGPQTSTPPPPPHSGGPKIPVPTYGSPSAIGVTKTW